MIDKAALKMLLVTVATFDELQPAHNQKLICNKSFDLLNKFNSKYSIYLRDKYTVSIVNVSF